jgi:hypothetical protein
MTAACVSVLVCNSTFGVSFIFVLPLAKFHAAADR